MLSDFAESWKKTAFLRTNLIINQKVWRNASKRDKHIEAGCLYLEAQAVYVLTRRGQKEVYKLGKVDSLNEVQVSIKTRFHVLATIWQTAYLLQVFFLKMVSR